MLRVLTSRAVEVYIVTFAHAAVLERLPDHGLE